MKGERGWNFLEELEKGGEGVSALDSLPEGGWLWGGTTTYQLSTLCSAL